MKIYNTLHRKVEEFKPIHEGRVDIYSCGPTVYWNQHIGHMYAYVQWDVLVRFLRVSGFKVRWVMNVTDVGHMTSDEDTGEDKMEVGAKREGVTVEQIAEKYIKQFKDSLKLLNVKFPDKLTRATEYIDEQIELAKKIEKRGFAYKTKMGLIFDTSKFVDYDKFARLRLEMLRKRDDVHDDPEKKLPWDFFLWVTGNKKHKMQWDSPWGRGYPGWHIECTAMSTAALGDKFDIHTGGIDHIGVHHTNEIAQAYGGLGDNTANYWLHNAMLLGKTGDKMSKSLGNFVTAQELVEKEHDPIALRYLFLTSHYRKGLNFTWDSLKAADTALRKLRAHISSFNSKKGRVELSKEKLAKLDELRDKFSSELGDDLNTPRALAVAWEVVKSNISSRDKYDLLMSFDEVLGLNLNRKIETVKIPEKVRKLAKSRDIIRNKGEFKKADRLRAQLVKLGFKLRDNGKNSEVVKIDD